MPTFRNRPHGNNVFIPLLLITTAFSLSNAGNRWCDYLYRVNLGYDSRYDFLGTKSTHIGMWSYEILSGTNTCVYYPSNLYIDTRFKSARIFSNWTTITGGIMFIMMLLSLCCGIDPITWYCMGFFLFLNVIFEGLIFLILSSAICDSNFATCQLAWGSKCGIAAIVFWFLAMISVKSVPAPKGLPVSGDPVTTTTTTTEVINPDGTKTVTTKTETTRV